MEEAGGLPSVGLHRVGHNWSDSAAAAEQLFQNKQFIKKTERNISTNQIVELYLNLDQRNYFSNICLWDNWNFKHWIFDMNELIIHYF